MSDSGINLLYTALIFTPSVCFTVSQTECSADRSISSSVSLTMKVALPATIALRMISPVSNLRSASLSVYSRATFMCSAKLNSTILTGVSGSVENAPQNNLNASSASPVP